MLLPRLPFWLVAQPEVSEGSTACSFPDICLPPPPLQSSTGSFSQKLWLGVAATSVSLYRQGEAEALESFPYGQICSYGVSDSNTFKITAGDRDLLFETTKVQSPRAPSSPPSPVEGGRRAGSEARSLSAPFVSTFSPAVLIGGTPLGRPSERSKLCAHDTPPPPCRCPDPL